jgi:hypothetical protein
MPPLPRFQVCHPLIEADVRLACAGGEFYQWCRGTCHGYGNVDCAAVVDDVDISCAAAHETYLAARIDGGDAVVTGDEVCGAVA